MGSHSIIRTATRRILDDRTSPPTEFFHRTSPPSHSARVRATIENAPEVRRWCQVTRFTKTMFSGLMSCTRSIPAQLLPMSGSAGCDWVPEGCGRTKSRDRKRSRTPPTEPVDLSWVYRGIVCHIASLKLKQSWKIGFWDTTFPLQRECCSLAAQQILTTTP